jgi:Protein of unknown function (DUF3349)
MRNRFRSVVDWLRAGYADEAPKTGHCPLIALQGPISLSQRQTQQVLDELGNRPADPVEIEVAITKATGQLPSDTQLRKIIRTLERQTRDF